MAADAPSLAGHRTGSSFGHDRLGEPSHYTTLENILFLQALRSQDLLSIDFDVLSKQLKDIPAITRDPTHDPTRLSPSALQALYDSILHEGLNNYDVEASQDETSLSPNPRKRKQSPPARSSIQETARHKKLVPILLLHYYDIFRKACIEEIRQYEEEYDRATRDIEEIKRGDWDAKLNRQIHDSTLHSAAVQNGSDMQDVEYAALGAASESVLSKPLLPQSESAQVQIDTANVDTTIVDRSVPNVTDIDAIPETTLLPESAGGEVPQDPAAVRQSSVGRSNRKLSVLLPARSSAQGNLQELSIKDSAPEALKQSSSALSGVSPKSGFHFQPPAPPAPPALAPPTQSSSTVFTTPFPIHAPGPADPHTTGGEALPPLPAATSTPTQGPAQPSDGDIVKSVLAGLRSRRNTWKPTDALPPVFPPSPKAPPTEPNSPVRKEFVPNLDITEMQNDKTSEDKRTKRRGRTTRSTSAISTTAARDGIKSRSQSVVSQIDQGQDLGRSVKDEPTTPAPTSEHGDAPVLQSPAVGTRKTRAGRGTAHDQSSAYPRPSGSRDASPAVSSSHAPSQRPAPGPRADFIYCTRNLNRTSSVILAQITGHRHAGPFQKPVSAKDIEGYRDMIKRPQDFKSIRAQTTAGSRAIAAALSSKGDETRASTPISHTPLPGTTPPGCGKRLECGLFGTHSGLDATACDCELGAARKGSPPHLCERGHVHARQ